MKTINDDTYVFIDVSNIRSACLRSCGFDIDFVKFYNYLRSKYPNLKDVRYYEGISSGDDKKRKHFEFLRKKVGYTICSLERKSYCEPPKFKSFICEKCQFPNNVCILPAVVKLKSNVDVFIASDMIKCAAEHRGSHALIILVSCDGDYVEAIQTALHVNATVNISILATPTTRRNNSLSSRLRVFSDRSSPRTSLVNIATIADHIAR